MPYLFSNISEIKQYVGGAANLSLELDSLQPALHAALNRHILRWLGQAQYNTLVQDLEKVSPPNTATALAPYVRRPLALLAMYEYSSVGGIQFSEAGIYRLETEGMKTPFKYQENEYRSWMLNNGYEAIEEMVLFLAANAGDYPDWESAGLLNDSRALFINSALELRAVYSHYISRYTYDIIRPLIEDIENFAILPLLGEDQFNDLKAGILIATLSEAEVTLINIIRRAVATFAVEEAFKRHLVKLSGRNVTVVEGPEAQTYESFSSPGDSATAVALRHLTEVGNIHIHRIKEYLTDHLDVFPLYSEYLDDIAEAAEETSTSSTDELYSSVWNTNGYVYQDDNGLCIPSRNSRPGSGFIRL